MNLKNIIPVIVVIFSIFLIFFKPLSVPPGLETDEGSIAYNSTLISKNLRDMNNRFLPFFVLSKDQMDWKQPTLIYLNAIVFKIFGASLLSFKITNILVVLTSLSIFYTSLRLLKFNNLFSSLGVIILATSPMVIITSRIGNESFLGLFFSVAWIFTILKYHHTSNKLWLALNALFLGVSFYSFKGLRIITPVWIMFTFLYLYLKTLYNSELTKSYNAHKLNFKDSLGKLISLIFSILFSSNFLKTSAIFLSFLLPFFLIIPFLESRYPGAVFDRQSIPLESYRFYFHYWLDNLSLSYLFASPDIGKIYIMEMFGAVLLSVLPFFLIGLLRSFSQLSNFTFTSAVFLATPILFGVAKSTDYSHRLVALVPFFTIIVIYGITEFIKLLNSAHTNFQRTILPIAGVFAILFGIYDFGSFFRYYFYEYPYHHETKVAFGNHLHLPLKSLSRISESGKYIPYVQEDIFNVQGDGARFYEAAYFNSPLNKWKLGEDIPRNSVLLTQNQYIQGYDNLNIDGISPLFILLKK